MVESDQFRDDSERRLPDGRTIPEDFPRDDVEMSLLLNRCFNLRDENPPPLYAQTLLGEAGQSPLADDFDERVAARVFARLALPRVTRVLSVTPPARSVRPVKGLARRLTLVGMATVVLLAFNALSSGAAFASVVSLIVGHSGARLVSHYPTNIATPQTSTKQPDQLVRFAPQWPGATVDGYQFVGEYITYGQSWSDGALVTLRYVKADTTGVHHLTILEFKPNAMQVLQVVQNDYAAPMPFGPTNGVFITGHWVRHGHSLIWQTGQRAELIVSGVGEPGLVLWISANDMNNLPTAAAQQLLSHFALSLKRLRYTDLPPTNDSVVVLGNQVPDAITQSFGNDVIALIPDTTDGAASTPIYLRIVPSANLGATNGGAGAP